MSDFIGSSCILIPPSAFSLLQYVVLVEVCEEIMALHMYI